MRHRSFCRSQPGSSAIAAKIERSRLVVLSLLVGVGVSSCGDGRGATEPPAALTCPSADVPLCSRLTKRAAAQDAASDAAARSLPALENASTRAALGTSLSRLSTALTAGNITDARAALTGSREALGGARGQLSTSPGDAADLASIELMLDQVAPLLGVS